MARANWNSLKFRALLLTLAVMVAAPAMGEVTFPVAVPTECVDLAQREGVPLVIANKYQAARAKIKLARLSGRDPIVHQCREAVDRARKAALQRPSPPRPATTGFELPEKIM